MAPRYYYMYAGSIIPRPFPFPLAREIFLPRDDLPHHRNSYLLLIGGFAFCRQCSADQLMQRRPSGHAGRQKDR